jgi:hypothetical protein
LCYNRIDDFRAVLKRKRVSEPSHDRNQIDRRGRGFKPDGGFSKRGSSSVLQMNREVARSLYVLTCVLIATPGKLRRNVRRQHSFCVSIARAYTIKRPMAFWIEHGLSERD